MFTHSVRRSSAKATAIAIISALPLLIGMPAHASITSPSPSPSPSPSSSRSSAALAASSGSWNVPYHTIYNNDPWPFAGRCIGQSTATYDANSNVLHVSSRATNTSAISGCRLKVTFTENLSFSGFAFSQTITRNIPTACSTTDLSCRPNPPAGVAGRGTGWDDFYQSFPAGFAVTSISGYSIAQRN